MYRNGFLIAALLLGCCGLRAQTPSGVESAEPIPPPSSGIAPWVLEAQNERGPAPQIAETPEGVIRPLWTLRTEYVAFWLESDQTPPLITTGPLSAPRPGALDDIFTLVRVDGRLYQKTYHGARFTLDGETDLPQARLDFTYFFLPGLDIDRNYFSPGSPVLARPFTNTQTGTQDSSLISYPDLVQGNFNIHRRSFFHGAELNVRTCFWEETALRANTLLGVRYLNLREDLVLSETDTGLINSGAFNGKVLSIQDAFRSNNQFLGGQFGLSGELTWKRLTMQVTGKLGLGWTQNYMNVSGGTTLFPENVFVPAGFYALGSNSGGHTQGRFSFVPELNCNLSLEITPRCHALIGYTFLYWTQVSRPGGSINPNLHPAQIPTSANFGAASDGNPGFFFDNAGLWAQGLSLGLEFRY